MSIATRETVSNVHLYTRDHQPATRYVVVLDIRKVDRIVTERHWIRHRPRYRVWARCCRRLRWAKHCTVQVYYDDLPFWCRPGRGCKQ